MKIVDKIKDKILTKLFREWVDGEYDIEMLQLTKQLISMRETELNRMIGIATRTEIKGFRKHG